MEKQCFETDGVGCSIMFLRKDKVGKKVNQPRFLNKEQYIGDVKNKDMKYLFGKNNVSIDPGKSDLINYIDGSNKDANTFRYYNQENATRQRSTSDSRNII